MSSYALFITRSAQKELAKLSSPVYERLKDSIYKLSSNPHPTSSKKLIARPGWRVRVGKYRVIYEIDEQQKTITVLDIGHRRDVYR